MGAVGVVWGVPFLGCSDDVRILLAVVLGETIGGRFSRGGLEVVKVAVFLLIVGETVAHVVKHSLGEGLGFFVGEILAQPVGIEADLVHTNKADGREVVIEAAKVTLGVRIEPGFEKIGDNGALGLEGTSGYVHEMVETGVEISLVLSQVGDAWQIDGDNANRAGAFAAAKEAAALFAQLAQVETQTAAHAAHVAWLHVAVDVVGEVWRAVFRGHLKKETVVFGVRPVEILGDGIGWDWVLEAATLGVAFNHDFDEGLVDHVHLALAVAVGEGHFLTADDGWEIFQVFRHGPVEGNVGKRRLGAPAARRVDAIDEAFDALLGLVVGEAVGLDERRQVGVKGREGLRPCPFVLHNAKEVDHLVAEGGQVLGWRRGDFPGDAAEAFLDQLLEAPAGAVAGEHREVVEMNVAAAMGIGHFLVIDFAEPVVGGDGAGVGKDQPADRIGDGGVFLDTPVFDIDVAVDEIFIVENRRGDIAHGLVVFAIENVGLGDICVAALAENALDAVLNVFNLNQVVLDLWLEVGCHAQGNQINNTVCILTLAGVKRLLDSGGNFF